MKTPAVIAQVEDYLVSRRAMGFELRGEGYQLRAFARFAGEQADAETLTLELLLRWVQGAAASVGFLLRMTSLSRTSCSWTYSREAPQPLRAEQGGRHY